MSEAAPEEVFDQDGAAAYLKISVSMLKQFRIQGGGPLFKPIGSRVIYRRKDLDSWLDELPSLHNTAERAQYLKQRKAS